MVDSELLRRGLQRVGTPLHDASVLVALTDRPEGQGVILEVRASRLSVQPGEVSLPGGSIEPGETPEHAAVRECAEELLVDPSQVQVLAPLGQIPGPAGIRLHAFCGTIEGYEGSFSADEVDRVFYLPVSWLLEHEPSCYEVGAQREFPPDFPWDKVPGGQDYHWRSYREHIPFYETEPVVWGATARVLERFTQVVRAGLVCRGV